MTEAAATAQRFEALPYRWVARLSQLRAALRLAPPTPLDWDEGTRMAPRRLQVARGLVEALAVHLGEEAAARLRLDLTGPADAPRTELVAEVVGGAPLPDAQEGERYEYVAQPWLEAVGSAPGMHWELTVEDVMLRRTRVFLDRYGNEHGEEVEHEAVRSRLRWRVRLGGREQACLKRLRAAPPLEGVGGPVQLRGTVRQGAAELSIALPVGHPISADRLAAWLRWWWPLPEERAASDEELAAAGEEVAEAGSAASEGPARVAYELPDEDEMRAIEAWAAQERRKTERMRWLSLIGATALGLALALMDFAMEEGLGEPGAVAFVLLVVLGAAAWRLLERGRRGR